MVCRDWSRGAHARITSLIAALVAGLPGYAQGADCIAAAARYHGINLQLMQAIVMQESGGQADAVNCANTNGTCDIGLTQINSRHLPRLEIYGVSRSDLFNPCVAAFVGAWILSENFERMGVTWDAVGAYNAGMSDKPAAHQRRLAYARKIYAKVQAIQRGMLVPATIPMRKAALARAASAAHASTAKAHAISTTDTTTSVPAEQPRRIAATSNAPASSGNGKPQEAAR